MAYIQVGNYENNSNSLKKIISSTPQPPVNNGTNTVDLQDAIAKLNASQKVYNDKLLNVDGSTGKVLQYGDVDKVTGDAEAKKIYDEYHPSPLAQAISPNYTKAQDNSSMISSSYTNLVSALKAQIQQAQNNKQMQINGLGEKYQPERNNSEVMRNTDLRSVLEQSANAGDRGGVGRQNALETQTSADNRMNTIDLQQKGEETSLKNDIANLLLEGNIQEAQYKSQELKDLIENNKYVDETNYNRQTNADNTAYSRNRDNINDTGKLANGEYTQSGKINSQNIAMNDADLKEKTDPNSITNQMAKIGLSTAQLNLAALPDQIKNETTQILQSIQKGDIDIATGKLQLEELTNPNSITNQLAKIGLDTAKLNLAALPDQIKGEALQLAQDLQKGTIDIKVANAQLKELTYPNSITNQMNRIGLNTAKLNYQALPTQLKNDALKVAQELQAGRINIATAQKQLDNLKSGKTASGGSPSGTKEVKPPSTVVSAAYSDYINASDPTAWINQNAKYFTDTELKAFMTLVNQAQ